MFGWLADLLVKSSVVGSSCPCCEGQKQQLKKMQKALLTNQIEDDVSSDVCCDCGGECHCDKSHQNDTTDQSPPEMSVTYHYKI